MAVRKVVRIDEEKCDGCGDCVPSCAEGAIQIIDGKAKLVSDVYCDGLGACLGTCPQDAITIEEREAEDFDEKKVQKHLDGLKPKSRPRPAPAPSHAGGHAMGGCPGSAMREMKPRAAAPPANGGSAGPSQLINWPIQMMLVAPHAPYFRDADLLLAADCVPFAHPDFHRTMLQGRPLIIGCPKLDEAEFYVEKLAEIITASNIRSITVPIMQVPCCMGLVQIAAAARQRAGVDIPIEAITVAIDGAILGKREVPAGSMF